MTYEIQIKSFSYQLIGEKLIKNDLFIRHLDPSN